MTFISGAASPGCSRRPPVMSPTIGVHRHSSAASIVASAGIFASEGALPQ